ncbi:hypothetical protein BGW80DRAFT_1370144 [Lactifluus volemus]|nr:hypothetical protein BGW80DRAFT_1370144 [Lactifluus volemus]
MALAYASVRQIATRARVASALPLAVNVTVVGCLFPTMKRPPSWGGQQQHQWCQCLSQLLTSVYDGSSTTEYPRSSKLRNRCDQRSGQRNPIDYTPARGHCPKGAQSSSS